MFTVSVAMLPLQWIPIGPGLLQSIAISDLGIAILGLSMVTRFLRRASQNDRRLDRFAMLLIGSTLLAVSVNSINFPNSPQSDVGRGLFLRDTLCGLLVWVLYVGLRGYDCRHVIHYLSLGLSLGAVLFFACMFFAAAKRGKNVVNIYVHAIATTDPNYVQHALYGKLFTEPGERRQAEDATGRHTIFLLMILGAATTWLNTRESWTGRKPRHWQWWMIGVFVFLVLVSLSRQTTVVMGVFFACIALGTRSQALPLATIGALLVGLALVVYPPLREMVETKFIDGVINNPRVAQYGRAISEISAEPWWGNGAGVRVSDGYFPHNFILHGWHQAGLAGLLATCLCLFSLLYLLGFYARVVLRRVEASVIPAIAIVTIGSITLARLMVGVRGSLEIASILAMVTALLLHRDFRLRGLANFTNDRSA